MSKFENVDHSQMASRKMLVWDNYKNDSISNSINNSALVSISSDLL